MYLWQWQVDNEKHLWKYNTNLEKVYHLGQHSVNEVQNAEFTFLNATVNTMMWSAVWKVFSFISLKYDYIAYIL